MIEELKAQIASLEGTVKMKQAEIQGMHDRVKNAEERSAQSLRDHERRTKEIESQFQDKEKVLQENLRKQMQRMIAEQTRELEEM